MFLVKQKDVLKRIPNYTISNQIRYSQTKNKESNV